MGHSAGGLSCLATSQLYLLHSSENICGEVPNVESSDERGRSAKKPRLHE